MKNTTLKKLVGTSAIALSLTVLSGGFVSPAQAGAPIDPTGDTTTGVQTDIDRDDDGFDWGWLGLLGLIGLAGLKGKENDDRTVSYRDREDATRTGTGPLR